MDLTADQRHDLAAAFSDFDTVLSLLTDAGALLDESKDKADTPEWYGHRARIDKAQQSVKGLKAIIAQAGDVYTAAADFFGPYSIMLPGATIRIVKGATLAMSAVNYDTRQYVKRLNGETPDPSSYAQAGEWGILGMLAGLVGEK